LNLRVPFGPRHEARERLGDRYDARVLEPSPPAVVEPPFFADDPVARGQSDGRPVVAPVPTGDLVWADLALEDPELAAWCAERWLAAHARLQAPPATLAETRAALHRVAQLLSRARAQAPGAKIGLRWTHGGFGTPFFGDDVQLRVLGDELVRRDRTGEHRAPLDALGAVAEVAGLPAPHVGAPLTVDAAASRWLGELFGFAVSVLEELRAEASDAAEPSRVQLWPEHFDVAVELGAEADGARATFGVSPGDDAQPEPYVYVVPGRAPEPDDERWNATAFAGAVLPLSELLAAAHQRAAALDFLRARRDALTSG
jgi:hypothetical protein